MSAATACLPTMPPSSLSSRHRPAVELAPADLPKATTPPTGTGDADVGMSNKPRAVVRPLTCERKQVGEGFAVWRSIGRPDMPDLDPFLSFDEFEFSPPAGFLDHPHRGFESVTYMLEGGFSYHDFSGHKGTIHTGDVQWMTAGRGVVHAEMPGGDGVQRGISIWINLSSKDKMVEPMYQETVSGDIPVADNGDGVSVKVIAGECLGARSTLRPRTPAMCLDVTLRPGARLRQPVPRGWSAVAYVIGGEAVFEGAAAAARARTFAVFGGDGDGVDVRCAGEAEVGARVILVAARPHGEAVVRDGPFVMNTREEVEQAREDYRHRRNGFERSDGWASDHANVAAATR